MITFNDEARFVCYTHDFDKTIEIYSQCLELEVFREWNHDGVRGIVYKLGAIFLEFLEKEAGKKENSSSYLYVQVQDIDVLYENISTLSEELLRCVSSLCVHEWGHKNFMVEDMVNGIKIKFFAEVS